MEMCRRQKLSQILHELHDTYKYNCEDLILAVSFSLLKQYFEFSLPGNESLAVLCVNDSQTVISSDIIHIIFM